jgi:hypothetical protein
MHIHDSVNFNITSVNPAAAAESATSKQRAENVRKRLMASADETDGVTSPDETSFLGQWMNATQNRALDDDEYHSHTEGRDSDFG